GLRLLNHGLSLDGHPLKPAKVTWQNEDQLRFVLREGRKRQIRRMCEMVGLKVVGLKRVRIGGVRLGDLPPGQWRYLGRNESLMPIAQDHKGSERSSTRPNQARAETGRGKTPAHPAKNSSGRTNARDGRRNDRGADS